MVSALKADLHIHVKGDPEDPISYTAKELIDKASSLHYNVLAITCHNLVFYPKEIVLYAKEKGIHLIPAAEKTLYGKHVLLYNITNEDLKNVQTFDDLRELKKKKNILVIAAHPYFKMSSCLGDLLEQHIDVFDAIEYAHFHTYFFNLNKKAVRIGKQHGIPLVGCSDSHSMKQFATTYSFIDAKKNTADIIQAIKNGKVKVVSPPLPLSRFLSISFWIFSSLLKRLLTGKGLP